MYGARRRACLYNRNPEHEKAGLRARLRLFVGGLGYDCPTRADCHGDKTAASPMQSSRRAEYVWRHHSNERPMRVLRGCS
eukprot:5401763-Pyramimonas_sp.AAC.2